MSRPAPHTILIFERDARKALVLRDAVVRGKLSWQLRFVADGKELMDYLEGKPPFDNRVIFPQPSLLLIGLDMPLVNGFEVLRQLRASPEMDQLPVIVFSSSVSEAGRVYARELGAKGSYPKPETVDEAIKVFEQLDRQWLHSRSPRFKV
jgi:CheY-like chemotaxis protein